ncbi:Fanconi anemia group J protein [Entomortierella beljakovae]|nr:Fanconi anemia group J protein [Entomortierella beljakovae]
MSKRIRTLPSTIDRGKEMESNKDKAKTKGKRMQGAGKQSRLNFYKYISSDSDNPSGVNSGGESDNDFVSDGVPINTKKNSKSSTSQAQRQLSTEPLKVTNNTGYPTEFFTGGVTIKFPFEPYQSQKDMMSSVMAPEPNIVEALQREENALLESPTGSGKSLALLCGALAWLESYKKDITNNSKQTVRDMAHQSKEQGVVESPYFTAETSIIEPESDRHVSSPKAPLKGLNLEVSTSTCETYSISCCKRNSKEDNYADVPSPKHSEISNEMAKSTEGDKEPQHGDLISRMRWKKAMELKYDSNNLKSDGDNLVQVNKPTGDAQNRLKIPKIYFGSRTHKQITQLVKELKSNTTYRPKMVVLGSRNHYCINPELKNVTNKNDACQELLDSEFASCYYKHQSNRLSEEISKSKKSKIWDMEDLISKGKSLSACPYFASRTLASEAELVFCPYNYLIDPHIRKAMEIDLENSILILDEAHNIEDASREAGGLDIIDEDLNLGAEQFEELCIQNILANSSSKLRNLAKMFSSILENQTRFTVKEYEQSTEIWTSQEILSKLDRYGLNQHTLQDFNCAYNDISKALKEMKERKKQENNGIQEEDSEDLPDFSVSPRVLRMIDGIITVMSRLLDPDLDCLDDYKIALIESVLRPTEKASLSVDDQKDSEDEAHGTESEPKKKKRKATISSWSQTRLNEGTLKKRREFKFWCMNPGVIFRPLSLMTRSVILTSGTLSPMESFASELQTSFEIRLEAGHVIDKSQVWAGVIPYGPNIVKIDGTYRSASGFPFQDELGHVIEKIIETTPHGVLCFLSSYSLMDNMINRWKATGQYNRLSTIKKVILEPRRATNKQFDKVLKDFYSHISRHVKKGSNGGALLFAVFRGKCSEGIDFTDSNCRAVLAVSIPFPGLNDLKVKLKKDYNDQQSFKHRQQNQLRLHPGPLNNTTSPSLADLNLQGLSHSSGSSKESMSNALTIQKIQSTRSLLSGNRWYEIQAFRALNQAIGRCIRHQRDWGAMVLLDYRFTQPNNQQCLSKWVRPLVKTFREFGVGISSMQNWINYISEKAESNQIGDTMVDSNISITEHVPSLSDADRSSDLVALPSDRPRHLEFINNRQILQESPDASNNNQAGIMPSLLKQEEVKDEKRVEVESTSSAASVTDSLIHIEPQDIMAKSEHIENELDAAWVLSAEDCLELDCITNASYQIQPESIGKQTEMHSDTDLSDDFIFDFGDDMDEGGEMDDNKEEKLVTERPIIQEITQCSVDSSDITNNLANSSIVSAPDDARDNIFDANDMKLSCEEMRPSLKSLSNTNKNRYLPSSTDFQEAKNNSSPWTSAKIPYPQDATSTQKSHASETLDSKFTQVVCKTCSKPILSCSEKPRIGSFKLSMAHELLRNRRMTMLVGSSSLGISSSLATLKAGDPIPSSLENPNATYSWSRDDNPRRVSNVSAEADASAHLIHPAMLLVLQRSHIQKMYFDTQNSSDELECIWRPRDGLFYQRIICADCNQKGVAGWKGVVIVGRSDGERTVDSNDIEVGTVWLTPGETRLAY